MNYIGIFSNRHIDKEGLFYYSSLLNDKKIIISEIKEKIKNSNKFKTK
jgi:hypothetical protein